MTTTKSYDALNRPTSIVSTNATVTLWSADSLSAVTPMYRRGELAFNNQQSAINQIVTNLAVLNNGTNADIISANIGRAFVPRTPEAFACDADGNLTNDGRWTYTWDAENRITSFTRPSTAPEAAKVKVDCQYDGRGRRTQKVVSSWNGSAYVAQSTNRFLYDGWNLVGILTPDSSLLTTFNWGSDLSSTPQGAGGVGGLKSMTVHSGSLAGTYFYCYDGNGNVAALVAAADGSVAAQYEYGPFGEVIRATGPLAQANPFLFSTKFCDPETGFYYYGYRYYDPISGRWLNRDPIGEMGGINLYSFDGNAPGDAIDYLGLLQVAVSGPVANQTVPTIEPGGGSGTTFHPRRFLFFPLKMVKCKCEKEKSLCVYRVKCEIRYTARIRLSRGEATTYGVPLDGIYGHEQMHILSVNYRVENEVASALRAETEDFASRRDCRAAAKNYEKDYAQRLRNVLWDGSSDHSDDPTSPHTPHSPGNATPYPPQPGSPPIR